MNLPSSHPVWMWLFFGGFGTVGMLLFIAILWNWTKYHRLLKGHSRAIAKWNAFGYMFLFMAQWFSCGIGGPPGNLLSENLSTHYLLGAIGSASLAMLASVPGWVCLLIGQKQLLKQAKKENKGVEQD